MPRTSEVVESLEELVKDKKKKYVRYEGAELYSIGGERAHYNSELM